MPSKLYCWFRTYSDFLNWWISYIGGLASDRVSACSLFIYLSIFSIFWQLHKIAIRHWSHHCKFPRQEPMRCSPWVCQTLLLLLCFLLRAAAALSSSMTTSWGALDPPLARKLPCWASYCLQKSSTSPCSFPCDLLGCTAGLFPHSDLQLYTENNISVASIRTVQSLDRVYYRWSMVKIQ